MHPDNYVPDELLERNGLAVWSLERELDRVAALMPQLGQQDVEDLRRCADRLLALIADIAERRAA